MTLREVIAQAEQRAQLLSQKHGELQYVVAASRGWSRSDLLIRLDLPADTDIQVFVEQAAQQLADGYPAEYLTGYAAFCDIVVRVREGVLVPRPETESLVQMAGDFIIEQDRPHAIALDLCSGSGAIALALAARLPQVAVVGLELDSISVSCSRESALDASLSERVRFVQGNVLAAWGLALADFRSRTDVIVSNPPYVREQRLFSAHASSPREPVQALYGGTSGMVFYKRIIAQACDWLRPGGLLLLEIDDGLEEGILNLFERYGLQGGCWSPDLRGLSRYAEARRAE
ncbi:MULTISPECIES: N5-glutamine methyltransferase family protein [Candidatus Cryosericum]|uniref:peptide chain release factor N(5)-glutamine methyltransferase n=2 Tax=Candidatus Cryosericum TaxID=2498709 RepID=A0A398DJW1_9BACT|nr:MULTISPECIES: HemK/PrmC family methyltransferase [Cryosericum]RIE09467.1 peptide chain release factor N(5)-glutamine methyltransferase [Candidatus Cryosericum hinesii]RIE10928.1 peptide chain release factor N(5)-glutamine methyltransferase [Candidatus Cryosericum odellii]RIE13344.1 peptide chain release factor N(5)-glutamine methyltransferase [Candidatus Cryosericum hinesii]RIE15130.1 peptide chain release factor N(5)-glutamine methyltransferase [Candidatus Cryosericum hinesii]